MQPVSATINEYLNIIENLSCIKQKFKPDCQEGRKKTLSENLGRPRQIWIPRQDENLAINYFFSFLQSNGFRKKIITYRH